MYDLKALEMEADCREVARFIGMRLNGKFCECVSGTHKETQLNHCAIYKDHIHCFSCGDNRNVFQMVQGYFTNVLGQPLSFSESCGIVGDCLGGRELYRIHESQESQESRKKNLLPFSEEDLQMIGLKSTERSCSIASLYRDDPVCAMAVIKSCAEGELERISKLSSMLGRSVFEAKVRTELDQRYARIQSIYRKAGGETHRVRKMFNLA